MSQQQRAKAGSLQKEITTTAGGLQLDTTGGLQRRTAAGGLQREPTAGGDDVFTRLEKEFQYGDINQDILRFKRRLENLQPESKESHARHEEPCREVESAADLLEGIGVFKGLVKEERIMDRHSGGPSDGPNLGGPIGGPNTLGHMVV